MVEHVVLHIGGDKTGSKAIQTAFRDYDDGRALFAPSRHAHHHNELCLVFDDPDGVQQHALYKSYYSELPAETVTRERRDRFEEFDALVRRDDREMLMFSGEGLITFSDFARRAMLAFFKERGVRLTIIGYARDPLGYAASSFQQVVKTVRRAELPQSITPYFKGFFDVYETVNAPSCLIIREFAPHTLHQGDVVADFCHQLGLPIRHGDVVNDSMTLSALRLVYAMNKAEAGVEKTFEERQRRMILVRDIIDRYADAERVPKAAFACLADYSQCALLKEKSGINFEPPVVAEEPNRGWSWRQALGFQTQQAPLATRADLEAFLSDLRPVDLRPIAGTLIPRRTKHDNIGSALVDAQKSVKVPDHVKHPLGA